MNPLIWIVPAVLAQAAPAADDWKATGAQVVGLVRDEFFDAARGRAWAEANAHYAAAATTPAEFVAATRGALRGLQASHTAYFTRDDPEYFGLQAIFRHAEGREPIEAVESIGVDVAPGGFVRVVFSGSPAASAGVRRGDQILRADGAEFRAVASFRGRAGRSVDLSIRRRRDEPPRSLAVTPRKINPRDEWLQAQQFGAHIIPARGKQVAYMPLFSAAGDEPRNLVRDAIEGPFAAADALILDFRDGWGGASPTFVDLFGTLAPRIETTGRDGNRGTIDPHWRKPLYILINGGSRSGKEVVVHAVKKHRLGTLVGEPTGGAVLAGKATTLRDGSLLYLAVLDVLVDGERLEGHGIVPDVAVADDLPYADGRDPQLERAVELAGSPR